MDARTARTLNIRDLVKNVGGPTRFANAYGGGAWPQGRVSRWISATNPVGIGHTLARKIESELNLPEGTLDYYPIGSAPIASPTRIADERAPYGDPDEIALIEMFRRLSKRKKRAILDLIATDAKGKDN